MKTEKINENHVWISKFNDGVVKFGKPKTNGYKHFMTHSLHEKRVKLMKALLKEAITDPTPMQDNDDLVGRILKVIEE